MIKYYNKLSPELIIMHMHDRAKFGDKYVDVDPSDRIQLDEVSNAIKYAIRSHAHGQERMTVRISRSPEMEITFASGCQIDESNYDSIYGAGAVEQAVLAAMQDVIDVEVADSMVKNRCAR